MKAIFTDPGAAIRLVLGETQVPVPAVDQALIKVEAISLNQGETRTALATADRYIPGWDFAGVVERAAADGSGWGVGTRVLGFVARGSWAEYVAAPAWLMAEIPEGVSMEQAASLSIAGGTAASALELAGALAGKRVLITGAAGGVGRFACQLAALENARVSALSRRPELLAQLREDGIEPAGVFTTMAEARAAGEYDIILDSVGGEVLAVALTALARSGVVINYGNSSRQPTRFDVRAAGWPLHGMRCIWKGREPTASNCTPILARLAELVAAGKLRVPMDSAVPWTRVAEAAERLVAGRVDGKIILKVG